MDILKHSLQNCYEQVGHSLDDKSETMYIALFKSDADQVWSGTETDLDETAFLCSFSSAFNDLYDFEFFRKVDHLDNIRRGSLEEFRRNGKEYDLDELDSFQLKHRSLISDGTISKHPGDKKTATRTKSKKYCVFCKNNGESESVFNSHVLKDCRGKTVCPILRRYKCPLCGTSGDNAHTIKYCPTQSTIG